jgi:ABC-type branched-subunit amino acid transport system substrate-binding protein
MIEGRQVGRGRSLTVALILAASFWACAAEAEILIGMAGPLTGPNAWPGEQTERGVMLAVDAWAQAVEVAGTLDTKAAIEALHADEFDTVLGHISFDHKGDVRGFEPFVWYVWRAGDYAPAVDPGN